MKHKLPECEHQRMPEDLEADRFQYEEARLFAKALEIEIEPYELLLPECDLKDRNGKPTCCYTVIRHYGCPEDKQAICISDDEG